MVEGPGCKVKGERLKPRIVGQPVTGIKGNVIQKKEKNKKDGEASFYSLIGKKIIDIKTLGKEFFIFFADFDHCLRIHWLMSGSFRLNQESLDGDWGKNVDISHSWQLNLAKDVVAFHKTAVCLKSTQESLDKIACMIYLDICSPSFSTAKATEVILLHSGRIVSDVLLDQEVLPGVGNIIKNEALFDSSINPHTRVQELSEAHIKHLVNMTRNFSMVFYKCRRDNKSLQPFLKIYRKETCKQCGTKTVTTKLGEDSARLTTYCQTCQNNTLKLPTKSSLLGWMKPKQTTDSGSDWACEQCTYVNSSNRSNCEMCFRAKDSVSNYQTLAKAIVHDIIDNTKRQSNSKPHLKSNQKYNESQMQHRTVVNRSQAADVKLEAKSARKRKCSPVECPTIQTEPLSDSVNEPSPKTRRQSHVAPLIPFKPLPGNSASVLARNSTRTDNVNSHKVFPSCMAKTMSVVSPNTLSRYSKTSTRTIGNTTDSNDNTSQGELSLLGAPPLCSGHHKKCTVRTVHKTGPNKGRIFWACAQSQKASCGYFEWADSKFPQCTGHDKVPVLRTVYKEGANNGRKFLACPLGKTNQCDFFQWLDN